MVKITRDLIVSRIDKNQYFGDDFKKDLLEYLNISNHPKASHLFRIAYELGHAYGYHEVLIYAEDLVKLIR